jgi:chemotaxis protein CheD
MLAEAAAEPDVLYVEPGQLTVCTEPRRLRTILGSCVSVCLYDPELRHGGMNHFMLPSAPSETEMSTRYGNRALPTLVERLERLGSKRRQLTAGVFGGARVLFGDSEFMHLGRRNVEFAQEWLSQHGISVVSSGVLGSAARRLEFDIGSGECSERTLGGR